MKRSVLDDAIEAAQTFFKDPRITRKWIWQRSKRREHVEPRHFICAFIRARNPQHYSYPMIARLTKRGDHTSALNSVRWAHKRWGHAIFVKLAAVEVVEVEQADTAQVVHSPGQDEIIAIGEANLTRFVNGAGWEQVA